MNSRIATLFLCGDVMLGRGIDQVLPHPSDPVLYEDCVGSALGYVELAECTNGPIRWPVDFSYVWGAALDEWRRAAPDLRIINLETSVTRSEVHLPKGINYRMNPDNIGCLLAAGIDCCALANNHVLDWGEDGLIETVETLERHGVRTAGAGRTLAEAAAPAVLEMPGKGRVLLFSFAAATSGTPPGWRASASRPGVNLLTDLSEAACDRIAEQVHAVRCAGDVVVVSIHWGPNWGYDVPQQHRRFAHALIDRAGVSIVHGHSSHHAMAMEVYRNRLILYGCGDFLNDYEGISGYQAFRGDLALMYFARLDSVSGDLVTLDITPLQIRRFRLNRATSEDTAWLRQVLDRESRQFGTLVRRASDSQLTLSWRDPSSAA